MSVSINNIRRVWENTVSRWNSVNVFSRELIPYWFILPFALVFVTFWGYPILWAPYMSLQEFTLSGTAWVGLEHYESLLNQQGFKRSVLNTFAISLLTLPITVGISLLLAIVVNSTFIRFKKGWRTVFLSPLTVSGVIISFIALIFFDTSGVINLFLRNQFSTEIMWTQSKWPSRFVVALLRSYAAVAISFLFLLSGLATIPDRLYKAAKIDGANKLQQFYHITLPQLRSMLVVVVILQTNAVLKIFAEPQIVSGTGRSPNPAIRVIIMELYRVSFVQLNLGRGAAIGVLLTIIVSVIVIIEYIIGETNE
jgi:ABC-type sugar transport system permease subunit